MGTFTSTPEEAVDGAHAIVILTEWDEFKTYKYDVFYNKMMKPAFLFDGRNLLDHVGLQKVGFEVHAIGKPKIGAGTEPILPAGSLHCIGTGPLTAVASYAVFEELPSDVRCGA